MRQRHGEHNRYDRYSRGLAQPGAKDDPSVHTPRLASLAAARALSSVGRERRPYKAEVAGSRPEAHIIVSRTRATPGSSSRGTSATSAPAVARGSSRPVAKHPCATDSGEAAGRPQEQFAHIAVGTSRSSGPGGGGDARASYPSAK